MEEHLEAFWEIFTQTARDRLYVRTSLDALPLPPKVARFQFEIRKRSPDDSQFKWHSFCAQVHCWRKMAQSETRLLFIAPLPLNQQSWRHLLNQVQGQNQCHWLNLASKIGKSESISTQITVYMKDLLIGHGLWSIKQ